MNRKWTKTKGVSLVEILFAVAIFSFTALGFMGSLIASSRASAVIPYEIMAENFASRIIERMQLRCRLGSIDKYELLGDSSADPEDSFLQTFTFESDPDNPETSVTFNVDVTFRGFGMVSSATDTTLTAQFPQGFHKWEDNAWEGNPVMIKNGRGNGQMAYILSNTDDTLTITRNLDGSPGDGWLSLPNPTSYFEINGGKTAKVVVSWTFKDKSYSSEREVLIYHP
ncbi:hypothetical protein JW926_04000, partial [Candidatus Sumerlaeota bacterium]|nr:hypothetical protein [Candidatus Sumerlaeota bacterium]